SSPAAAAPPAAGSSPGPSDEEILSRLRPFQHEDQFYLAPELPAGGLYKARKSSRVPPAEPVLALLDFTGDEEDAPQSLLFGSTGIYFHVENNGEGVTHSVPYAEFGRRRFLNHGKEVYLGEGVLLTPPDDFEAVSCETICRMLDALKQASVQGRPGA